MVSSLNRVILFSNQLKRFVYTASFASVFDPNATNMPSHVDDSCWNETSYQTVLEKGREADPLTKYRASKVLAERGMCAI